MVKKSTDEREEKEEKPAKFDGQDFHVWKRRMTTYLKDKKLWAITQKEFTPFADEKSPTANEKKLRAEEQESNYRAKNKIESRVTDTIHHLIQEDFMAKQAWECLVSSLERKSQPNRNALTRRITRLKMKDNSAAGENVTNEQHISHLLTKLPEAYDVAVANIQNDDRVVADYNKVVARLLDCEEKIKDRENTTEEAEAFAADKSRTSKKGKERDTGRSENEKGGGGRNGRRGGRGRKYSGRKKFASNEVSSNPVAFLASVGADGDLEDLNARVSETHLVGSKGRDHRWILDSGATHHMTFEKDGLRNFRPASSRVKTAEHGNGIQVKGVGDLTLSVKIGKLAVKIGKLAKSIKLKN
ncbi:hypothetical protein HDU67_001951, partial [Dinochytrium kinnereticum]